MAFSSKCWMTPEGNKIEFHTYSETYSSASMTYFNKNHGKIMIRTVKAQHFHPVIPQDPPGAAASRTKTIPVLQGEDLEKMRQVTGVGKDRWPGHGKSCGESQENHGKSLGKWRFYGILWDLASGFIGRAAPLCWPSSRRAGAGSAR